MYTYIKTNTYIYNFKLTDTMENNILSKIQTIHGNNLMIMVKEFFNEYRNIIDLHTSNPDITYNPPLPIEHFSVFMDIDLISEIKIIAKKICDNRIFLNRSKLFGINMAHTNTLGNQFNIDEKFICNLTHISNIPHEVKVILGLGPKFGLPTTSVNWTKIIADLQFIIDRYIAPPMQIQCSREMLIKLQPFNHSPPNKIQEYIIHAVSFTKKFLDNQNICITKSDKGNVTVLMSKNDYSEKMFDLLNNTNVYRVLEEHNHFFIIHNRAKSYIMTINRLFKSQNLKLTDGSHWPKIYGLPKIHKTNFPLRPVVCTINSPGYPISFFLNELLIEFIEDDWSIKNSSELKNFLNEITIETNYVFVSFDIKNMFTNIPVELVIEIIMNISEEIERKRGIPSELLSRILKFTLIDCAIFEYNNILYKQNFGLAMGSPFSPLAARYVTTNLLNNTIRLHLELMIKFFKIYVDDAICLLPVCSIEPTLNLLNSFHKNIQFTVEHETNNTINFLDISITRINNRIVTNWYEKDFSSGRILNFFSNHPKQTIKATAMSFIKNVKKLSDPCFNIDNIHRIRTKLKRNNYPDTLIDALLKDHFYNFNSNTIKKPNTTYSVIDYYPKLFYTISNTLNTYNNSFTLSGCVVKSNYNAFFSKLKDKNPITNNTNCVFSIENNTNTILHHTSFNSNINSDIIRNNYNGKIQILSRSKYFSRVPYRYASLSVSNKYDILNMTPVTLFKGFNKFLQQKINQTPNI